MKTPQTHFRIAIIGAGHLGASLGTKWAAHGHQIRFGIRDLYSPRVQSILAAQLAGVEIDTIESAIQFAELVVLAIPPEAIPAIIAQYYHELRGKVLLDPSHSTHELFGSRQPFWGLCLLGLENLEQPYFGDMPADLFYCSASDEFVCVRMDMLIGQLGFRPVRLGGLEFVGLLNAMKCALIGISKSRRFGHRLSFKLLS